LWLPNKLAEDVDFLISNPSVGLLCSDAVQIDSAGNEIRSLLAYGYSGKVTSKLLQNNFVLMSTHLARTAEVRKVGGFREERELSGSEDWELWVRFSTVVDFAYRPKITAKIRTHQDNTMGDAGAMKRSMGSAVAIMQTSEYLTVEEKKSLSRTKAMVSLVNAINYCTARNRRLAVRSLKDSFISDPRILSDLRFGYTVLRLVLGERLSQLRGR
jgi:hypothetical protein